MVTKKRSLDKYLKNTDNMRPMLQDQRSDPAALVNFAFTHEIGHALEHARDAADAFSETDNRLARRDAEVRLPHYRKSGEQYADKFAASVLSAMGITNWRTDLIAGQAMGPGGQNTRSSFVLD
jgi:Zn-dependent peptidase ImmA (M78 family)